MGSKATRILADLAAFAVGTPLAFFSVGPALFADGPLSQAYALVPVTGAVFFGVGLGAGLLAHSHGWRIGLWLAGPSLPIALFFAGADRFRADLSLLGAVFVLAVGAGATGGAALGARWRSHRALY